MNDSAEALPDARCSAREPGAGHRQPGGVVAVPCCSHAYTFVEKLQTASTKFRLQQAADTAAPFTKNFLRHYYDLYCLIGHPEVLAFIGAPDYEARKRQHFRGGDELNIAGNPAFTLSDPAVGERYQHKYEETAGRPVLRRPGPVCRYPGAHRRTHRSSLSHEHQEFDSIVC